MPGSIQHVTISRLVTIGEGTVVVSLPLHITVFPDVLFSAILSYNVCCADVHFGPVLS